MKRLIVTLASLVLLVWGVSAAGALPRVAGPALPGAGLPGSAGPAALPGLRTWSSTDAGNLLGPRQLLDRPLPVADPAPGGSAQNPFARLADGAFAGYGAGTAFHSDAALAGKERPADIEAAFAAASFSSSALPARLDELGRSLAPDLKPNRGFGRASSLDFRVADEKDDIDTQADAEAPPGRGVTTKQPVPGAKLPPIFDADALRSQASARSAADGCVLGSDLAYGLAAADNTQVADTRTKKDDPRRPMLSLSSDDPTRALTQTVSRIRLIPPGVNGSVNFGVLSEVRQTIAPVTFDVGSEKFTVEVGGEWVLRAVANGAKGALTFGADESSGDRPMLRVIDGKGHVVDEQDLAALTGKQAIVVGGMTLFLGEDPRAVGSVGEGPAKPMITGTMVAAAMDVVRLQALDAENNPVQLRVGHAEVGIAVPPQGVPCPGIGLVKALDRGAVQPDERFTWNITVVNPNDCLLDGVYLEDAITASDGLRYRIVATAPPSRFARDGVLAFDGLGALHGGQSRSVRVDVQVLPDSAPGRFSDATTATGMCHPDPVPGEEDTSVGVGAAAPVSVQRDGRVTLEGPVVQTPVPSVAGATPPMPVIPAVSTNLPPSSPAVRAAAGVASSVTRPVSAAVDRPRAVSVTGTGSGAGSASHPGGLATTGGVALIPGPLLLGTGWVLRRSGSRRRRPMA